MKALFALLVAAICLSLPAQAQSSADTQISSTWGQPIGTTQWPMQYCGGTVTVSCVTGYTYQVTLPSGTVDTIPECAAGVSAGTAASPCVGSSNIGGSTITYAWIPGGNLACGTYTTSVAANWLNAAGTPISSAAISTTVSVPCPFVASPPNTITSKAS